MPQIGWSEILVIILVAIIVIGPKDLPIVVRKFIQKLLEYEKREKNSIIPGFHFKSFYEMEEYEAKINIPETNVISVLLKYCINYIHPIVQEQDIIIAEKKYKKGGKDGLQNFTFGAEQRFFEHLEKCCKMRIWT